MGKQADSEDHESSNDLGVSNLKLGQFHFSAKDAGEVHEGMGTVGKKLCSNIWVQDLCSDFHFLEGDAEAHCVDIAFRKNDGRDIREVGGRHRKRGGSSRL